MKKEEASRHLIVRNPDLNNRIGSWATVMLTACGQKLPPSSPERVPKDEDEFGVTVGGVTLREDMVTCKPCRAWAKKHPDAFKEDEQGRRVTA